MRGEKCSVYCAGPLFTGKEKEEMEDLALALEAEGFSTFLPQRDGLEMIACTTLLLSKGLRREEATRIVSQAIFALDVYQVVKVCDAIAVNLNGRVPDEGAISEAALAWCANKIVVGYKADQRSVFMGHDNPLVAGLFNFKMNSTIPDLVAMLNQEFEDRKERRQRAHYRGHHLKGCLELGSKIWVALAEHRNAEIVANMLFRVFSANNGDNLSESVSFSIDERLCAKACSPQ
jgi:nucleoside 2-deoxyribosyltransferase